MSDLFTADLRAEAVAALDDDDATYELDESRSLRLRIEPDEDTSVFDDEFFGKFAWPDRRTNEAGYAMRPDGFDGNAEKLGYGRSYDRIWWQPPSDVPRTSEHFAGLRRTVLDHLEYGYSGYIVELLDGVDAYRRPVVRYEASLWGIGPNDFKVDADIVGELVNEVLGQVEDEAADLLTVMAG